MILHWAHLCIQIHFSHTSTAIYSHKRVVIAGLKVHWIEQRRRGPSVSEMQSMHLAVFVFLTVVKCLHCSASCRRSAGRPPTVDLARAATWPPAAPSRPAGRAPRESTLGTSAALVEARARRLPSTWRPVAEAAVVVHVPTLTDRHLSPRGAPSSGDPTASSTR